MLGYLNLLGRGYSVHVDTAIARHEGWEHAWYNYIIVKKIKAVPIEKLPLRLVDAYKFPGAKLL